MSTVSSYILRQTMGPLLAAVAIALLVLLTERMLRLLDLGMPGWPELAFCTASMASARIAFAMSR